MIKHNMRACHRYSYLTMLADVFHVLILLNMIDFVAVTALPIPGLLHDEVSPVHLNTVTDLDVDELVISSSAVTRNKVNHYKLNPDTNLYMKRAIFAQKSHHRRDHK